MFSKSSALPQKKYNFTLILLIVISLATSSCSLLGDKAPSGALRKILLGLSTGHIRAVFNADMEAIGQTANLASYLSRRQIPSRKDFLAQLKSAQPVWEKHSQILQTLRAMDVSTKESVAQVIFEAASPKGPIRLAVFLEWSGGGWMIVDDNIFGSQGFYEVVSGL